MHFASYILKILCTHHDYSQVANILCLSSLAEWRHTVGNRFLEKLLNGKIDSTELLSLICFMVPQHSNHTAVHFYACHASTNYLINVTLRWLMTNANVEYCNNNNNNIILMCNDISRISNDRPCHGSR